MLVVATVLLVAPASAAPWFSFHVHDAGGRDGSAGGAGQRCYTIDRGAQTLSVPLSPPTRTLFEGPPFHRTAAQRNDLGSSPAGTPWAPDSLCAPGWFPRERWRGSSTCPRRRSHRLHDTQGPSGVGLPGVAVEADTAYTLHTVAHTRTDIALGRQEVHGLHRA